MEWLTSLLSMFGGGSGAALGGSGAVAGLTGGPYSFSMPSTAPTSAGIMPGTGALSYPGISAALGGSPEPVSSGGSYAKSVSDAGKLLGGQGSVSGSGAPPLTQPLSLRRSGGQMIPLPNTEEIQMYDSPIATLQSTRERLRRGRVSVPTIPLIPRSFNPSGTMSVNQIAAALGAGS